MTKGGDKPDNRGKEEEAFDARDNEAKGILFSL